MLIIAGPLAVGVGGVAGSPAERPTVIVSVTVPQLLLANNEISDCDVPKVTVIELVPCPAVMIAPPETVQLYVALATAFTE